MDVNNMSREEIAQAYAEKYLGFTGKVEFLGNGYYAQVFAVGDLVVKVTTDPHDAISCNKVIGKDYKHIVKIHKVAKLGGRTDSLFIIVSDKIRTVSYDGDTYESVLKLYFNVVRWHLQKHYEDRFMVVQSLEEVLNDPDEMYYVYNYNPAYKSDLQGINEQLVELTDDLRKIGIKNLDFHGANVGFLGNTLQMFDLGHKSAGDEVENLEELILS